MGSFETPSSKVRNQMRLVMIAQSHRRFDTIAFKGSNIQGFYCPESGRISFVRKDINTNDAFQSYSGNLSDVDKELRMGGTFTELNQPDHLGEYNFCFANAPWSPIALRLFG